MGIRLGVLVIHGIGEHKEDFAAGLVRRLKRRLRGRADEVGFAPCWWAPLLQQSQDAVWKRLLGAGKPMRWIELREKVVSYLGDPPTYLAGFFRGKDEATYTGVHRCVRESLRSLAARMDAPDRTPLMVLAHSMGSTIVSNYVWDEQHGQGLAGSTPFERMHTLTSFLTYGSTIPLFIPPVEEVKCIEFPPPELRPELRPAAAWENVYDADDLLGYPLHEAFTDHRGTRIIDIPIDAGLPVVSWTPFSHVSYDRDDDFLDVVQNRIEKILAAVDAAGG